MPEAIPSSTPSTPAAASPAPAAAPSQAPQGPTTVSAAVSAVQPAVPTAAVEPAPVVAPSSSAQPATAPAVVPTSLIGENAAALPEAEKPAEAAAEPGAYDLKMPEGVEANPVLLDSAKAIFTEAKIDPAVAQKLTTFHGEQMKQLGQALVAKQIETWNTTITGWQKEVTADKDLGGAKWGATKAAIEGGLQTVFGVTPTTPANAPERANHKAFVDALAYTGAGSNLAILRGLHRMVAVRSEGRPAPVGAPSAPKMSAAEKMYGTKQAAE